MKNINPLSPLHMTNEDQKPNGQFPSLSGTLIINQSPSELFQYRLNQLLQSTQPKADDRNVTKKSIYIARDIVSLINRYCIESFDTDEKDDMGLLFCHIKESIAMQINDKQITIHNTIKGQVIILNVDLHFKDKEIMYLVAMSNVPEKRTRTPWKIITIMRADTIYKFYKITQHMLPKSSRKMNHFVQGLITSPHQIYVPTSVIWQTDFKKLCNKESKRQQMTDVDIRESDLKMFCCMSWNNNIFVPAVFITGNRVYIEWKKCVRIFDDANCNQQWVAISLRFNWSNKQWTIGCMDYDAGRVYYQFRLLGDYHNYHFSYNGLSKLINTKLNIL